MTWLDSLTFITREAMAFQQTNLMAATKNNTSMH
jgi:hypothetical protein